MEHDQEARWINAVAETLRAERGIAGLSQAEAARRSGITRSSYRYYEQGVRQPSVDQVAAIAEAFGVTFLHLVAEVQRRAIGE